MRHFPSLIYKCEIFIYMTILKHKSMTLKPSSTSVIKWYLVARNSKFTATLFPHNYFSFAKTDPEKTRDPHPARCMHACMHQQISNIIVLNLIIISKLDLYSTFNANRYVHQSLHAIQFFPLFTRPPSASHSLSRYSISLSLKNPLVT